jgi:proteasome component ECM29
MAEQLKRVVVREAKRNNEVYRPHAFRCLWRVAAVREDLEMVGEIAEIVGEYLVGEEADQDAMDVDEPRGGKGRSKGLDLKSRTVWAAIEAIVRGYNRAKMRQDPMAALREVVLALESAAGSRSKALDTSSPCIARLEFETIRRTFWYDCVKEVMEDAAGGVVVTDVNSSSLAGAQEVVKWFFNTLDLQADDAGTEDQRTARVKAAKATISLAKAKAGLAVDNEWGTEIRGVLDGALEKERSLEVQKAWRECVQLLSA